jgi:pimeloyl-ACP methyl ester carboxylesterase
MRKLLPLALALLLAPAAASAALSTAAYTRPGTLVAVDGARRLNLVCMGSGDVTVLFDAGAGNNASTWRLVQSEIAKVARACAYDRAGYGFSDAATRASDVNNTVDDLHRLIAKAPLKQPLVYVGHSIAGLYGAVLATRYPNDVAGVVLVDPSFADQYVRMLAAMPPAKRAGLKNAATGMIAGVSACLALAEKGALAHPQSKAEKDCIGPSDPRTGSALNDALLQQYASSKYLRANVSEFSSIAIASGVETVDKRQVDAAHITLDRKPLAILTQSALTPALPGLNEDEMKTIHAVWVAGHDRLAKLSTRGSNLVIANSGHYIQIDQPGAVIVAIRKIVGDVQRLSARVSRASAPPRGRP